MKPKLKMVEIYSGNVKEWEGYYNLVLHTDNGSSIPIAGPIEPETSKQIIEAMEDK